MKSLMPRPQRKKALALRQSLNRRVFGGWTQFVSLCLCALCGSSQAAEADGATALDPDAERAAMQVAEGFEVSLFASEKEGVLKPIQMRFDTRGRLWVIGSTVYPQLAPGQEPNDKVLVLEDTDGDGKCDKTTVFADGLMIPTGIELTGDGVLLGHGPELLLLRDRDGDLKADEREVVLRGFGTGDNHQNINSFLWGPGGELWFCQGLHTHSNVETPWGIVRMNQAGAWRYRPKLKKLEAFFGSAHEPQNPWGWVFTDWGEPILIAGNNSSTIYPVPGLTSRHLDLPPTLIWKNGQGRKSSGGDIVGTAHFPDDWQGVLITGGYINNAVWALNIMQDGAGLALTDRPPLIKSTSRSFRPVDVKFAPDGSLYLCDWSNPIIGHYQASFRHPDRDKTSGRIWRVTAKGRALTSPPKLAGAPIPELLGLMDSSDRWTRNFAKRELAGRETAEVAAAIQEKSKRPVSEMALKEMLGVLQAHEAVNEEIVKRLAKGSMAAFRAYAADAVGRWADRLGNPLEILQPLAVDAHPSVRLHAIVAASYIPQAESLDLLAAAAERERDHFIDFALRQAVFALQPHWSPALRTGTIDLARSPSHLNLLVQTESAGEALQAVRSLLSSKTQNSEQEAKLWRALMQHGDSGDVERLVQDFEVEPGRTLLPEAAALAKSRGLPPSPRAAEILNAPARARNPAALRLAGLWRVEPLQAELRRIAEEGALPSEVRLAAIEGLGFSKNASAQAVLESLAAPSSASNSEAKTAAIIALAAIAPEKSAELAAAAASSLKADQWRQIVLAFLQRQNGPALLAKPLATNPPPPAVGAATLQLMNEAGRTDSALALALAPKQGSKLGLADVAQLAAEVRSNGDARRGEAVYRRPELACAACHAVKGQGGAMGPDLGALGTAQPVDFILGAVLEPQREVKEGYLAVAIAKKDGEEIQGYPLRETGAELVLRETLFNQTVAIPKSEIQKRRAIGSLMPAGLVDQLTRAELVDLAKYLSELGK